MFVISWIRSSDVQASDASKAQNGVAPVVNDDIDACTSEAAAMEGQHQDDWVFLPSDHNDLMESSISDLDLLSASMTLYPARSSPSTASAHPASSRTRVNALDSSSSSGATNDSNVPVQKSKRQLKQEMRMKQALEELERKPRYDPATAKMRDQELKMAKMAKLTMRSGKSMSSTPVTQARAC
ncbi:hypothetical protein BGX21_007165 [Mortierella sp. AD011]|nr:hypothetical protein BGX20_005275 [Mortierella sp. AD010]KAF9398869.1 hypothetical protein BGX21_007165 [Mortierella sp. AD011]